MRSFDEYLKESTDETLLGVDPSAIDEGVIGSFMAARFIHQGNLAGFLPSLIPSLQGKACMAVEGACGTGGKAIASAIKAILSDLADVVFVTCFEMQNSVKSVYGADILAGAGDYRKERKEGGALFFPGIFNRRLEAYLKKYPKSKAAEAMATWYQEAIEKARAFPKAQEYENRTEDLFALGMTPPDSSQFLSCLNPYHCSKITDGAASILIASEKGLNNLRRKKSDAIEILSIGEAEGNITTPPQDETSLPMTALAAKKALNMASKNIQEITHFEIHDCFAITAILAMEALALAPAGGGGEYILDKKEPLFNRSGGLIGFGHPTGASGVRMLVDLEKGLKEKRDGLGMLISMGGNDITVTAILAALPS